MAPWSTLTQCCGHLSKRKPPPLTMVPITLACITSFLVLLYISFTSDVNFIHSKNSSITSFDDHVPQVVIKSSQHELITKNPHQKEPWVSTNLDGSSNSASGDDDRRFFFNDTTIPLSPFAGSSVNIENHDEEVYHDKEIFLQSYEEMKKSLKIYTYLHKSNDPFAKSLLPVDDHEPGGNYASETYFKNVLFKSRFITHNPSKADLFFLPFSIARLRHDNRVGIGGLKYFVRDYMKNVSLNYPYWNRTSGADHFYVACHSIARVAMEMVEHVKSNAIQVTCSSSYFLSNYFAHKDVSLPQIWPRHEDPSDLGLTKRKKLAFFAGAVNSPLRKKVLQAWQNDSSIFVHSGRLKTPYSEQFLRSKYCLHLKGFEVNTARIGDALYYGCVPVILADHYDLPFMDILNWKSFSVVITSSNIPKLKNILLSIGPKEYSILHANVLKVRRHFQWNRSPLDYDAFYMVMYELWLRRSSIRIFS